jgi:2'-5' RNA ligase
MDGLDHYRLFIALSISDSVRREMEVAQNELREALPGRAVRWTRPDQFHLTLKFLGDVPVGRVDLLIDSVRKACACFSSLSLIAEGLGCFPNERRPRVIWIGMHDHPQLKPLQSAINIATTEFGQAELEKDFKGHFTIGRIKEISSLERKTLTRLLSELRARSFGNWTANEVKIIRSELSDSGVTHKDVMAIPLNKP